MVKCEYCGKEMTETDPGIHKGCTFDLVEIDDVWHRRLRVGRDRFTSHLGEGERCHDCNALVGHCHHLGCDSEECPVCGGQLGMGCGCNAVNLGMEG